MVENIDIFEINVNREDYMKSMMCHKVISVFFLIFIFAISPYGKSEETKNEDSE